MSGNDESPDEASDTTLFARLLMDAAVSDSRFARQVNERWQRLRRTQLGLARTTIGHWRRGMRPRDPVVAELAAAELSNIVGYEVTPGDLGWRGDSRHGDDLGLAAVQTPSLTLRTLAGLSGRDMRRHDLALDGSAFVVTAFADPVLRALTDIIERVGDAGTVSTPTAAVIREMTATFRGLDARYGSGEIRSQVIGFLHDRTRNALGWAHTPDLFSALAELTQFSGWLAQDSDRHSLAQRYYVQALALAEHSGDTLLSSRVLAAMSDQAAQLEHRRESLALARAALERAGDRANHRVNPTVLSMLYDKAAWAHARLGDRAECDRQLINLDKEIGRSDPGDTPAWAAHYNDVDAIECQGHCAMLLGDHERAEGLLMISRERQSPGRTRTRAYAEADLALSFLRRAAPDLDRAHEAGDLAVQLATGLESQRIRTKMGELTEALLPHDRVVAIHELWARTVPLGPGGPRPVAGP
jgi:hypothetical protein